MSNETAVKIKDGRSAPRKPHVPLPRSATKELGHEIARRRNNMGLTQEELAEKLGLKRQYLSDVERAYKNTGVDSIERIAKGLGLRLALVPLTSDEVIANNVESIQ